MTEADSRHPAVLLTCSPVPLQAGFPTWGLGERWRDLPVSFLKTLCFINLSCAEDENGFAMDDLIEAPWILSAKSVSWWLMYHKYLVPQVTRAFWVPSAYYTSLGPSIIAVYTLVNHACFIFIILCDLSVFNMPCMFYLSGLSSCAAG